MSAGFKARAGRDVVVSACECGAIGEGVKKLVEFLCLGGKCEWGKLSRGKDVDLPQSREEEERPEDCSVAQTGE